MSLLIDSQILCWFVLGSARLRPELVKRLSETTDVAVSVASRWELGIKAKLGRFPYLASIDAALDANMFRILPIELRHVRLAAELPLLHKDPFDRMIVGQAMAESLTLMTADKLLSAYSVEAVVA